MCFAGRAYVLEAEFSCKGTVLGSSADLRHLVSGFTNGLIGVTGRGGYRG